MQHRNIHQFVGVVAAITLAAGCGGNKPKPNQVFLMPAPGIYEEGKIDPWIDNDPISRGVQPGILYATDRAVAAEDDKKYDYYTHERGRVLRIGEAYTKMGGSPDFAPEEPHRQLPARSDAH